MKILILFSALFLFQGCGSSSSTPNTQNSNRPSNTNVPAATSPVTPAQNANGSPNSNTPVAAGSPAPVQTTKIPRDGDYPGKGVVTKVDMEAGWVEIDHEAIPEVMPQKMTMMFNVTDKAILKGISPGDKVDFVLEYKHPTELVKSIKKTS